jgi:hypothetical protein
MGDGIDLGVAELIVEWCQAHPKTTLKEVLEHLELRVVSLKRLRQ